MSTSERRAGRTSSRDRLLDAAAGFVASQGIQNLTIEAVAAAAKVTKAGLVYHFKTRDDLLAALIERVVGELDMLDLRAQEARDAREADDSAKPLKSSMAELSKLTFDMPEDRRLLLANLLAATSLYPHLAGPVRDFFSRSYARVAQSGPDAGQVLALVVALDGIALLEVLNLHRFTPEQRQVLRDTLESAIRKLPGSLIHFEGLTMHSRSMPQAGRLVLCALVSAALLSACQPSAAPVADVPRPVKVEVAGGAGQAHADTFVATLRARQRTDLGFESSGRVVAMLVDVGDRVRAGQVLARLDESPARWRLDKATADRAAAAATLAERRTHLRQQEELARDGIISAPALQAAQASHQQAASQLGVAEAAVASARRDLAFTRITAPFDGEIVARQVQPFVDVAAGQRACCRWKPAARWKPS